MKFIILFLIFTFAYFDSAAYQPLAHSKNMNIVPVGMNPDGQFVIAQPGDIITNTTQADWTAVSGLAQILNEPTIPPSMAPTSSTLTLALVGTGATGTQISSTEPSFIACGVSTSTTSTIGGASTSLVTLKICATNSSTEGNWTSIAILENDQTISLALALQSTQIIKGQLCANIPAAWFAKLVNSGTGTHTEAFVSGQQTVFG